MESISVNGLSLCCQKLGTGAPLVMSHGLVFGSMATWYFTAAAALAARYSVILYDQRGHGKSDLSETGYDLATLSADLDQVVQHYVDGQEAITLVGYSYGALLSLHYALQHPQRIARLVLIDAPLPASRFIYPSLANIQTEADLQGYLSESMRQKLARGDRAARRLQERLNFLFLRSTLRQDVAVARDIADADLQKLTMPVLCLYGRHSDCLSAGERLARVLPNAQLRLLECGHDIPQDLPAEMTRELEQFL